MISLRWMALVAASVLALAKPAEAATCRANDRAQWARDAQALTAAQDAFQADGFDGLRGEMTSLEAVTSHSPADGAELAACGLTADQWSQSPYPMASMLLGAARVEFGLGAEAEAALRRGLLMTPHNPMLAAEAGAALVMQRKFEAVITLANPILQSPDEMDPREKARLHRIVGFAFVELHRLDEGEAAYRESLRLDPTNPTAAQELEYIRQLRAGGQETEGEIINTPPPQPVRPNDGT